MTILTMTLLGTLRVTLAGQTVTHFRSAKVPALLAYLAVEAGRPHHRDALAGLLWPEKSDLAALNNLRYTLSQLRTALGDRETSPPFLLISRDHVQWNADSDYWLDVDEFLSRTGGSSPPIDSPTAIPRLQIDNLRSAVALYRGPFLEGGGATFTGSAAFEEWVLYERERLHRLVLDALQQLALFYEAQGELDQVEHYTRRSLELDPWQEGAQRRLMRLLARHGKRSAALAQYEICRSQLADELGIEPEPETRALYERIRDGKLPTREIGKPIEQVAIPEMPTGTPFVSRERELARLEGFLDKALAGHGQVALVTGSAGSGKTALLREFVARAMARHGALVAVAGSCSAQCGIGDPYLAFRELLQMLAGQLEPRHASCVVSPEHARRLWHLLPTVVQALIEAGPDLIGRFVPAESLASRVEAWAPGGMALRATLDDLIRRRAPDSSPARSPETLFEQVTRVLHTVAHDQPLILVLDDLQWAQASSASLLFHLGRRLAGSRILLVGAYRPDEVDLHPDGSRHPLRSVVDEFQRDLGDIEVNLDQADGRPFVDALLDAQPNDLRAPFRDRLYDLTEGHALFTVELVREMEERAGLVRDAAGRWIEGQALKWDRLPSRVEAVIAGHVGRLPSAWQQTLAIAAVEGEVFTAEVLARVQGLELGEVLRRLNGHLGRQHNLVVGHGLEQVGDEVLSRYRFRHHLFQRYLYGGLDAAERAHLHRAVGQALERLIGADAGELATAASRLAFHFEAAGLVGKAVTYLQQAGQEAHRLSALEESIAIYERALALLQRLPPGEERDRRELALQLGLAEPCEVARGWGSPKQVAAVTRAYELSLALEEPNELLSTLLYLSHAVHGEGKYRQALHLCQQALALDQGVHDTHLLVVAHQQAGVAHFLLGELVQAYEHLEQAADLWHLQTHRPDPSTRVRPVPDCPHPTFAHPDVVLPHPVDVGLPRPGAGPLPDGNGRQNGPGIVTQARTPPLSSRRRPLPGSGARSRSEQGWVAVNTELLFQALQGEAAALEAATERLLGLFNEERMTLFQAYGTCLRGVGPCQAGPRRPRSCGNARWPGCHARLWDGSPACPISPPYWPRPICARRSPKQGCSSWTRPWP